MFDTVFTGTMSPSDLSINAISVLISIVLALLLGLVMSLTYLVSTPRHQRSSSFVLSLIVLPSLVAVVIILIGGSIARAFTTAGIFTLIKFRSVPGDSRDLSYIFLSMAVGLSLGLGYLTLAAVITVVICAVMLIINKFFINKSRQRGKKLRITIPEDLNYDGVFDEVFSKYTAHHELIRVKTTNMGTMLELHYDIVLKSGISEKEFIDELRLRNGNLTIQLDINEAAVQQL